MLSLAALIWLVSVVGTELWNRRTSTAGRGAEVVASAPSTAPSSDELLARSLAQFDLYDSLSARLRQRVELFGQRLVGSGVYMQSGDRTRLELRMQLQDMVSTLLEVCDGKYLWTHRVLVGGHDNSKVDVARVLAADPQPGQGGVLPKLTLGGFSRFVQSLRGTFDFGEVAPDQLGEMPVWRLRGTWKPAQLAQFLPEQKARIEAGQGGDLKKMEHHVPDEVFLYLGAEDAFPYRVEFRRDERTIVSLEVSELQINGTLDPALFRFDAGADEPSVVDVTAEFLSLQGLVEK